MTGDRQRSTGRVRLVQVGLGGWGFNWAQEILPTVPLIEPVGYVDIAEAARKRLSVELGVDRSLCFASLEEALEAGPCDAVLVTLPMTLHGPATRAALDCGKHVLVEKPFTETLAEAVPLVELATERRLTLMVSQNYRFYPASIRAADLAQGSELGELVAIGLDFRRHVASAGFRYWDLLQPLLSDMAVHHFDLLRFVTGREAVRVSCRTWTPPDSRFTRPSSAFALIELAGGVLVSYRASIDSRGPDTAWGGEWAMEFVEGAVDWATRGDMGARLAMDRLSIRRLGAGEQAETLVPPPHIDRAGTTDAFARTILEGREPPRFSSGRDNLQSLALVEACVRSAEAEGAWAELEDVLETSPGR